MEFFNPNNVFAGVFIPNLMMAYTGISSEAKIVYVASLQYLEENKGLFPSIEELSDSTGLSNMKIKKSIKDLCSDELIVKVNRQEGDTSKREGVQYKFLPHRVFRIPTWS